MAAHSAGFRSIPPVAFDQPPTGWPQWLREMAQSINLVSSWVGTVTAPGEGGGEGGGGTVTVGDTPPAGTQGALWFDSVDCQLYTWYDDPSADAGQWVIANSGIPGVSGGAATFIGDEPPSDPVAGQLWFESDTGQTFIWYTDADSSQWVPAGVGQSPPDGGGGTVILDGSGAPADALGEVGDYYVDAGRAMYGPKTGGIAYGDPQNAFPSALIPNPGFSHSTLEVYNFVKVTKVGQITAVKFWYDNTTTQTSFKVNVWSTVGAAAGTRLGTATLAVTGGLTGWRTATLTTPVDVAALDVVCVSVGFTNAYSRKDGEAFPITNGGDISSTLSGYGVGLDVYPGASASTAINFYVDAVFREAISLAWPVAVPGWVQLTQAAYDALSPPDPDTLYVVVG